MLQLQWVRRALPLALVASVYFPALAAGQGIPANHRPVSTTASDIAAVRAAYAEAFNAKDANAVNAFYTADAVAITANGGQLVGAKAIGKLNSDSAATWPHAVITSTGLKIYGSTAVDVGTFTAHPAGGGEFVSRYLVVLRHDVKGWRIQYASNTPMMK